MKECRADHNFEQLLRQHHMRPTKGRVAILHALHERGAQSADELAAAEKHEFDRVTAYRALKQLLAAGIVVPVAHSDGAARYELADHHRERLVCVKCGVCEILSDCSVSNIDTQALKKSSIFSSVTAHAVEFFGTCKQCAVVNTL